MTNIEKKNEKIFLKEFRIAIAVFLLLLAVTTVAQLYHLQGISNIVITILPVAPLFFALWAMIKHHRSMDEYIQRVTSEAFLWSTGIVSLLCVGYGLLEFVMEMPTVSIAFVLPAVVGIAGMAKSILIWVDNHG